METLEALKRPPKSADLPTDEAFAQIFLVGGVKLSRSKKAAIRELTYKFKRRPTDANKQKLLDMQAKCAADAKAPKAREPKQPVKYERKRERLRLLKKSATLTLKAQYLAAKADDWRFQEPETMKRREAWEALRDMPLDQFIATFDQAKTKEAKARARADKANAAARGGSAASR